jgi:hypothetical protein
MDFIALGSPFVRPVQHLPFDPADTSRPEANAFQGLPSLL